jgi:cytochrome c biogenesis factor
MEYVAIAAAVASAVGTISAAQNQARNFEAQSQAMEYNARVNEQAGANALLAASANEDAKRRENSMKVGAQRAALIEGGMDITSGTGADLVYQSNVNTELDALNIRYQGALQSKGYNDQATIDRMQASNARSNAKAATGPGMWASAAGSALSSYAGAKYLTR